jgi:hypothetical protein
VLVGPGHDTYDDPERRDRERERHLRDEPDDTDCAPLTVTGAEAGCPNANWTVVNPILTVTSISLRISQGGALLCTCIASDPDGLTGTVPLRC